MVWLFALTGCGGTDNEPAPVDAGNAGQTQAATTAQAAPQPANAAAPAVNEDRKGNSDRDSDEEETVNAPPPGPANERRFSLRHGDSDGQAPLQNLPDAGNVEPATATTTTTVLRPENVDAWTDEDFISAAREHDAKLLDAIDAKVKSMPGDASVAILLTSLLDPDFPALTNPSEATSQPTPQEPDSGKDTPPVAIPPQSSFNAPRDTTATGNEPALAIDSVAAMLLEASVAYLPQGAAVGAVASGVQERIRGGSGNNPNSIAGDNSEQSSGRNSRRADREDDDRNDAGISPNSPANGFPAGNAPGTTQKIKQFEDRELVEHVIDGLITNSSQNAWQAIYGVAAGTVKTPLAAELNCEIIVERLFQNMDSKSDVIQPVLLTFLDGSVAIPATNRQACLRMFAAISARKIDTLTGFASPDPATPGTPPAQNGFSAPAAGNGLIGGIGRRARDRDDDDGAFIPRSGNAAGQNAFGVNGFGGNGVGAQAVQSETSSLPVLTLAPETVARGAEFLWSSKAVAAITRQLEGITDLATGGDIILLASTIPVAEVRQALSETFVRLHAAGSDGLRSVGLFADVHDPALLVVMKSLPRTRPQKETPGIMDSWTSGTENLVLSLRNKMRVNSGSMKPYTDTLPVKLHKNATAEISVMMEMPAGVAASSENNVPAPTQVYYIRTNFTPQKQRDIEDLTSHYEGRTSGFSRPDPPKGVMWIEGVKTLPNGHRRSLDVVIEKSGTGGASGAFSIEIIVVDTLDPKVAGAAETTQASSEK